MEKFLIKEVASNNIVKELNYIGFDSMYSQVAQHKFFHKNIKIYNLSPAQANIIKQTALIFGADCAVHKEVITGKIEKSDAILCGSYSQLQKIATKLKAQPFKLGQLGAQIIDFLNYKKRETKIVGILNITQDSFSDGGLYFSPKNAQEHLLKLITDGADVIDIGAESTRPNSTPIEPNEQISRLKPILEFCQKENIKIPLSIDTRSSLVADFSLNNGATIINDVSGFDYDSKMIDVISKYSAQIVIQHSQGTPDVMQQNPSYKNVVEEIFFSLREKINFANSNGVENIIIDPGIGFGKTKEHNFEILNRVEEFYALSKPVMIGLSRKSFLTSGEQDNTTKDSLSLALSYPLVLKGVDYLRVHNVKLHKELLQLANVIPSWVI